MCDKKWLYVMETKAWNGLMAEFRKSSGGAPWSGSPTVAAMGMTYDEAAACAKWLRGRIPKSEEWDDAAGFPPEENKALLRRGTAGVGRPTARVVKDAG